MKLLLIGSGGREHALAWALAKSPKLSKLYAAPGNAGIAKVAELTDLDVSDHKAVIAFCREKAIDLVVVGPEAPLVAGIVDDLEEAGIKAFGPRRAPAQLEGSKAFTKGVCDEAGIPTAGYGRFDTAAAALAYVREKGAPIVVKADGLAAGKGVTLVRRKKPSTPVSTDRSAMPARKSLSRSFWKARKRVSSFSRMERTPCRWQPPRITSEPSTATRGRIPAAWGPIHPLPC